MSTRLRHFYTIAILAACWFAWASFRANWGGGIIGRIKIQNSLLVAAGLGIGAATYTLYGLLGLTATGAVSALLNNKRSQFFPRTNYELSSRDLFNIQIIAHTSLVCGGLESLIRKQAQSIVSPSSPLLGDKLHLSLASGRSLRCILAAGQILGLLEGIRRNHDFFDDYEKVQQYCIEYFTRAHAGALSLEQDDLTAIVRESDLRSLLQGANHGIEEIGSANLWTLSGRLMSLYEAAADLVDVGLASVRTDPHSGKILGD